MPPDAEETRLEDQMKQARAKMRAARGTDSFPAALAVWQEAQRRLSAHRKERKRREREQRRQNRKP